MDPAKSQDVEVLFEKLISNSDTTEREPDSLDTMDENIILAHLLNPNTSCPGFDTQRKVYERPMAKKQLNFNNSPLFKQPMVRDPDIAEPYNLFGHHRLYPLQMSVTKQGSAAHSRWTEIPNAKLCSSKLPNGSDSINGKTSGRRRKVQQPSKPVPPIATAEVRARIERNQGIRILEQPIRCQKRCKEGFSEPVVKRFLQIPLPSEVPFYSQPPVRSHGQQLRFLHDRMQMQQSNQTPVQAQPHQTTSTSSQTDFIEENIQELKMLNDREAMDNERRKDVTIFKIIIENLQRRIGELTQEKSSLELFVERNICWNCGGGSGTAFSELCSEMTKAIQHTDDSFKTAQPQYSLTSL